MKKTKKLHKQGGKNSTLSSQTKLEAQKRTENEVEKVISGSEIGLQGVETKTMALLKVLRVNAKCSYSQAEVRERARKTQSATYRGHELGKQTAPSALTQRIGSASK